MGEPRPGELRKGFAVASLVLGILSLPTLGLLGVGAMTGVVLGVVGLVKANRSPTEYGGRGLAVAGIALSVVSIVAIPFLGIVAAIAIPSLLRARIAANESAAIGDVRTVIVAESSYQAINGGYYDRLACLAEPGHCIPGYAGSSLLPAELGAAETKNGYRRRFHGGAAASPLPPTVSPTSMMSFAYVAVPATKGTTGVRAFCGDATGRVCAGKDGEMPEALDGACPADCVDLR
jgi:type IV pilus assembly protein PilA